MIRASGAGRPLPCWAGAHGGVRGHYLPGCTADGCAEHGSLPAAVAVCVHLVQQLGPSGCGGVTADEARGSFQTRAGGQLRKGPAEETSWVRTACARDDDEFGGGGRRLGGGGGGGGEEEEELCEACAYLVQLVTRRLASRRRSEAEVLGAIDAVCDGDDASATPERGAKEALRFACNVLRAEEHADALERALRAAPRTASPLVVCAGALSQCA